MKKLTLEERLNILDYKILEKRLNNIEKSLDKKFGKSAKNEYSKRTNERGLLRGVIGKVNANDEDAVAIAAILKDKYKIPESVITSKGDKYNFKLNISFYDKESINGLLERYAEKHKGSLADNIIVYNYSLDLSESENDKMTAQLKKGNVKFSMDDGRASRDRSFKGDSEILDEIKGLSMASYDKVAKTLVDMLKKNIDQNIISNICNNKEVLELIGEGMTNISFNFAKSLIRELEAKSPYKVEWGSYSGNGGMKIAGTFHIDNGGKETGQYDIDISIGNGTIYVYHHGKGDRKEVYYNQLTGDIVKDFNKAVVASVKVNREKIEAGKFDFENTSLD